MLSRRKSRILCVQALYAWEARGQVLTPDLTAFSWSPQAGKEVGLEDRFYFSRQLFLGTIDNINRIDLCLKANIKNWDFSRMNKLDLAILRMSVYCLLFQLDMDRSIVIDEALQISREYSDAHSYKFINGVLDAVHP